MGRATTLSEIRTPEKKKTLKMNQKLIFVLILALALIASEAAPQFGLGQILGGGRFGNGGRYGGYGGNGNTKQTLKHIGAKKLVGGLALKTFGAVTGNQGLQNLGLGIAKLGAIKTVGAHFFKK